MITGEIKSVNKMNRQIYFYFQVNYAIHSPGVAAEHLLQEGGGALGHVGVKFGRVELRHLNFGFGLQWIFVLERQAAA